MSEMGRVMFHSVDESGVATIGYIDADKQLKTISTDNVPYILHAVHQPAANRPVESNFPGSNDQRAEFIRTSRENTIANNLRGRSNDIIEKIRETYPNAWRMPDGNYVITSRDFTTSRGQSYRYELLVHRKPNEEFVAYVRETPLDPDGLPSGQAVINKMSPQTHSFTHLQNQINSLILGSSQGKGIEGTNPRNWFNQGNKREAEVTHPATGMQVPRSLAPTDLTTRYIGDTGIETTNDPIKDAVISYISGLVERGVSTYEVLRRVSGNVLSNSQSLDVIERVEANRAFPGVNAIPYMSADGKNIVRVGDRVRHVDGRLGVVRKRRPLSVNRKSQGNYGYTDVLVVKFDGIAQGTPIVAKNLEILRRGDGTAPLTEVKPEPLTSPYAQPALPKGFEVADPSATTRTYSYSGDNKALKKVSFAVESARDLANNRMFVARQYLNNRKEVARRVFNDNNLAQAWVERRAAKEYEKRMAESAASFEDTPGAPLQSPISTPDLGDFDPESTPNPRALSPVEQEVADSIEVEVIGRGITQFRFPGLNGSDDQVFTVRTIKGKLVAYYGGEKGSTRDAQARTLSPSGSILFEDGNTLDSMKSAIIEEMADRVQFNREGSHKVTLPYRGKELEVDLDYGAWYGIKSSSISRDHFVRDPETGKISVAPERMQEIVQELDSHIDGVQRPEGEPTLTFLSGLPASGKGQFTKKGKSLNQQHGIPTTRQFRESDAIESAESTDSPQAVLIDPDILKMRTKEVRVKHFRQLANLAAKKLGMDPMFNPSPDDDKWANESHEESSILAKMLLQAASNEGLNIVYDGTNNSRKKVQQVMAAAVSNNPNYRFRMHGLLVDPRETMPTALVRGNEMGRIVPLLPQVKTVTGLTEAMADGDSPANRMWQANVQVTMPDGTVETRGFDAFTLNGRDTSDGPWKFPLMATYNPETGGLDFAGDTVEERNANENFWLGFTNVSKDPQSRDQLEAELTDLLKNKMKNPTDSNEVPEAQREALASLAAIYGNFSDVPGLSSAEFENLSPGQQYELLSKFVNSVQTGEISIGEYNKKVNEILESAEFKELNSTIEKAKQDGTLNNVAKLLKYLEPRKAK